MVIDGLNKAEKIEGLWRRVWLIFIISLLVNGVSAYFGIGNEIISSELGRIAAEEIETAKALFAIGQVVWGVFMSLCIIFIPALLFWTLSDIELKKLIYIQLLVLTITLIEEAIHIPFQLFLGLPKLSSLFSLGIIGQSITSIKFFHYMLAEITIFKVWAIIIQYIYIRALSERSKLVIMLMILSFHLIFIIISALFHMQNWAKLL